MPPSPRWIGENCCIAKPGLRIWIPMRIILGSRFRIYIRTRVKSWIRGPHHIQNSEAVEAQNGVITL
jgi:hypothetical protein